MTASGPHPTVDGSLATLVDRYAATLAAAGIETPDVDARLLACHALDLTTAALRTAPLPEPARLEALDRLVARRADRVPLQLIVGETWFRHLRLACRPGVFIPRPETEVVAGLAIRAARDAGPRPVVVDLCTGGGAVALAIATEVAGAEVIGVDRDRRAIELAEANLGAVRTGAAAVDGLASGATCTFLRGDLFDPVPGGLTGRIAVVVSNPPYLPERDRAGLPPEVADHEPVAALVGGSDGHELVDAILAAAAVRLAETGVVVVEIDERRGGDAVASAVRAGLDEARVEQDLTGADRVLVARRPERGGRR